MIMELLQRKDQIKLVMLTVVTLKEKPSIIFLRWLLFFMFGLWPESIVEQTTIYNS